MFVKANYFAARTVRGVSFSIKKGEKFAILGDPRGASAIFEVILGYKRQIAGSYTLYGTVNADFKTMHGLVGYQPHTNGIDDDLTVM